MLAKSMAGKFVFNEIMLDASFLVIEKFSIDDAADDVESIRAVMRDFKLCRG